VGMVMVTGLLTVAVLPEVVGYQQRNRRVRGASAGPAHRYRTSPSAS